MKTGRAHLNARPAAFTLVEVMVGMIVIGVSVFALYGAICSSYDTTCLARENLRATEILTEKTEAIRLYDWDQITTADFIPATFSTPFDVASTNAPGPTYNGTITIKRIPHNVSYA